jgi:PAS domain S-box-containing protein
MASTTDKTGMIKTHFTVPIANQLVFVAFILLYMAVTQLSVAYAPSGFVAIIWPASGLALAAVLIKGNCYAWAVLIAAMISYSLLGKPFGVVLAISIGNTLEALVGALLLTRHSTQAFTLGSLRSYTHLVFLAGFLACSLSAITGSATLLFSGLIPRDTYLNTVCHWWMGDALGVILITPLLLVWQKTAFVWPNPKQLIEIIFLFSLTLFANQIVFLHLFHNNIDLAYTNYWMFLFVSWSAVRFGLHGTTTLILLIATQALLGMYSNLNGLTIEMAEAELVNYWFYIIVLSGVGMILASYFTELKQTGQALQHSEAAVKHALNALTDQQYAVDQHAIVETTDKEGHITYANAKFCQISGYPLAELLGQNHRMHNSGQHSTEFFKTLYGTITQGNVWHGEICNRNKDQQLYWVDTTIVPIKDAQGEPQQFIAIRTDISGHKRTEAALQERECVLREAQEVAKVGHYITDLKAATWESSAVLDDIFGIDAAFDKTVANWVKIIHPDHVQGMFAGYYHAINTKNRLEQSYKIIRPNDGEERWVAASGMCYYDQENTPLRLIGTIQDITERRLARLELEQHRDHLQQMITERTAELLSAKEMAERANQSKTLFLSNMSHELRTPIHAILSFSKLGLEKSQQPICSLATLQHYFEYIVQSGDRLLPLINDLLDLSKLEAGKMTFNVSPHNLRELTLSIVGEIALLAHQKHINLDLADIPSDLIVVCEATKIAQVLRNLLANAIKFSPAGSTIKLTASSIQLGDRRAHHDDRGERAAVAFNVIDQGIGIPENERDSIFDQFVQSSKTKTTAGGTGLGLAICREIITGHGGTIQAFNNPEGGCRFTFTLPQQRACLTA